MAKVNQTELSDVVATRDGKQRTFTRQTWNLLGPAKQGWSEVKADPKELAENTIPVGKKTTKGKATKAPIVKQLSIAQKKKSGQSAENTIPSGSDAGLSAEDIAAKNLGGSDGQDN